MINKKQWLKVKNGFTLIELLVVISIIGILVALSVVSYTSAQRQARDTARKSDLSQYRNTIESYANKNNGLYPLDPSSTYASANLCTTLNTSLGTTGNCPEDPKYAVDNTYPQYKYQSDGSGTAYVLWAKLENVVTTTYWVVCSTGQSGKYLTSYVPSFSGAICPTLTQ